METSGVRFENKIAKQKKISFLANFAILAGFFWYCCYYLHRLRDALSPVCEIFITKEPLGKG